MCPTLLGRLQTRIVILILPAILAGLLSLLTGNAEWIALIGIYLSLGVLWDCLVYRPIISWQPGWLTGILAIGEYVLLMVVALALEFSIPFWQATLFYWAVWVIAQCVRIVVLPLFFLTRLEDGGELRRPEWTIPAQLEQLPVLASAGEELPERLSGLWRRPSEIGQPLPAPSQIGPIPPEFLAALERGPR
ncbi:MAG TPA: hypothetical protein VNT51_03070 [Miltoncostaeaceae bacterium]|nr:hypothetical protein [Miltoncostaeaceae bacterium]